MKPTTAAVALVFYSAFCIHHSAFASILAEPTQEDVLRSIGQKVNESDGSGRVLAMIAAAGGVVALLLVVGQRRRGDGQPKSLNSHPKLLKEVLRTVPLKPAEVKQLRLLLQESRGRGGEVGTVQSPLTLVLCPSLMLKAAQARSEKVNRKVVAGLAKKLGAR